MKDQHPKVDPTLLFPLPFLSSPFHSFPHSLGIIVVERDEACLEWPYDLILGREYYEHEDRLALDDDYAKAMGERMERRREERKEGRAELDRLLGVGPS